MPPTSRKRSAQAGSDIQSSSKRTQANKLDPEDVSRIANSEEDEIEEAESKLKPKLKKSQKTSAILASTATLTGSTPASTAAAKTVTTKSVKAKASEADPVSTISPKRTRKPIKTGSVKLEEEDEDEEQVDTNAQASKKSRKRKAANEEETGGLGVPDKSEEAASPKKPKRKRKTQEKKDAEAMPLATRTAGLGMFIGAHVSGAKGVQNAVTNCVHIGGNAFALFLKSQRKWENPPLQDEHRDGFRANCIEHKYDATRHIVPHGSYLVNLAQEEPDKARQAYNSFVEDLHRCEALGIKLYNFHPGTTGNSSRPAAIARIASALNRALSSTQTVTPLLENMAGSGNVIGSTFADLASIISLIEEKHRPRIGICLDTCHLLAAGYDLRSQSSFAAVLQELDKEVGMQYVKALHLNDSKAPFGSRRDLHANIGTGFLGLRAFWNVVNEKRFEGLPMVLETPIDRKVGTASRTSDDAGPGDEGKAQLEDGEEESGDAKGKAKGKGKNKTPMKAPKEKTVEDKSIWAREIKLLESLIGMDPEGDEFLRLEKELADQGAEERKKYQEAFDRKVAKEEKVKTKSIDSFFLKGKAKGKANGKKEEDPVVDEGSPLSELSDLSDGSEN
ncbi:MAG: hypothetical protein L6R41_000334 [Letrouitia leprolyta]|nr:MAG: hypothetical protein L6R41_000334 [Letrouitia leprolyta]